MYSASCKQRLQANTERRVSQRVFPEKGWVWHKAWEGKKESSSLLLDCPPCKCVGHHWERGLGLAACSSGNAGAEARCMKMLALWGGEVAPLKGIFHSISHSPTISLTQDGGRPGAGGFLLLMWRKSVSKCLKDQGGAQGEPSLP